MKNSILKYLFSITLVSAILSGTAGASALRSIDADTIKSSDHSKTWTMPSVTGTLLKANTAITPATNLKITYDANGFVTAGTTAAITDLSDVLVSSPSTDQVLKWNGSQWANGTVNTVASSQAFTYYLDDAAVASGYNGLLTAPNTVTGTITDTVAATSGTSPVFMEGYIGPAIGGTQIDGGVWEFDTYCSTSASSGTDTIGIDTFRVVAGAGTVTMTGTGTTRTATVTGGTPFVSGDANANVRLAGYLQTPTGVFQITAFTSSSVVSIATTIGYTNESGVAYSAHKYLFSVDTSDINTVSPAVELQEPVSVQPSFSANATDKIAARYYASSSSGGGGHNISFYHNGTTSYSHIHTPLITRHNDLAGIQGGTAGEYYHLTLTQKNNATQNASASLTGLLSSTDWSTFNSKQNAITPAQETPSGTVNGSNQTFTLAHTPTSGTLILMLDGVFQVPGVGNDYTISGGTITMLTAPVAGQSLYASYTY